MTCKVASRFVMAFILLSIFSLAAITPARSHAAGGATIVRAVTQYFGKEASGEAAQWISKKGGQEVAQRLGAKAMAEGGEATVLRIGDLASRYGPDAVRGLDNVPQLRPVLGALEELPEQQVGPALSRLAAGQQGKELAETVSRYGVGAIRAELKHPGVGVRFASSLGDEGIAAAEHLTTAQAISIGRHVDDIAKLPPSQRTALTKMIAEQGDRFAAFVDDFVKSNPGKTLFTLSGAAVVLANRDAIFGGDKIVLDKDGNPVLISTRGLIERAGSRVSSEVSERLVSPFVNVLVPVAALIATVYGSIKLYGVWKRQQRALAAAQESNLKS